MTPQSPPEMLLTQQDDSDPVSASPSAGKLIKAARQARGVHLAVLAVTLKVPVSLLEALEADRYEAFKGGTTFLRAITSAICRQLRIDSAPVLALLPSAVSSIDTSRPAHKPLSGGQRISLRSARGLPRHMLPVLGLAILMLLVTAAFLWLPSPATWWPSWAGPSSADAAVEESAVPLGQASNPESTEDAAQPTAPASSASSAAAVSSAPAAALPAPTPLASAASPQSASRLVVSPAVLRLEASADTWVEVREAQAPPAGKLLKAGESMEVTPSMPYSVVIGRAMAVKATLRGQPFDLKPHTPQTVARFEVKE